jgi:hypothetical protein
VLWLERLQPLFALMTVAALTYQGWLVWRRPPARRTRLMLVVFWSSLATAVAIGVTWFALWLRYR